MSHCAFGKFEENVGYLLFSPLHLPRSVNSPVLTEYGFKWAPIAVAGMSSDDLQNHLL
jgi:hypothetical protein